MKIQRIDRKLEKDIVSMLIMDDNFIARMRNVADLRYFKNPHCRLIAKWAFDYYDRFGISPKSHIGRIYDYNERKGRIDKDADVDLLKETLEKAAEDYAETPEANVDFYIAKAEEYFNRVKLEYLIDDCEEMLEGGRIGEAMETVLNYKSIRVGQAAGTDGLVDEAELREAFSERQQSLFRIPGDVGDMLNSELCRDKFIVLQAPEKTGKTYWLLWLALHALRARLKVVMFELEMTKNQVNRRMSVSISGISDMAKYCDGLRIPRRFSMDGDGEDVGCLPEGLKVVYEDREPCEPLDFKEAFEKNRKFYEHFHLKKDRHWRLVTAPARSLNIRQIDAELERLEKEEDFVPDVVLIDYMDILGPENPKEQDRERINSNWVAAKALCNKHHVFLASVTQSNAATYGMAVQSRASFSEDHRKYAHTNGTLGLTQTPDDKKASIAKLNWLVLREGDFNEKDVCYILQCLKRGRFCVDSMNAVHFAIEKYERERGGGDFNGSGNAGRRPGRRTSGRRDD